MKFRAAGAHGPVLMTAFCSGIALVPLALSPDEPGREFTILSRP